MRWGAAIATVFMLISGVVADDAVKTGKTLTLEEAEAEIRLEPDYLSLKDVTSVTPQVAAALAKHKGDGLSLPDLKSLTPETAAPLCTYRGELALDGLEQLSVATAQVLAKHECRLTLNGITSLSDDAALALAKHKGGLCMGGLRELRCEPLARQLLLTSNGFWVGGDGGLNPERLTEISPEVAELLVIKEQDRDGLSLPELKSPSIDVLKVLARLNGDLQLGIASLTPEMANVLVSHKGGTLSVAVQDTHALRVLMKHDGSFENALALDIPEVTPEVASVLATFKGTIYLPAGMLSGEVEQILAASRTAYFYINPSVINTSEFAAKLVASRKFRNDSSEKIIWPELKGVSAAVAKELAVFPGVMVLPAIEEVSPDVANALAECKGQLVLPALRELTSVPLAKKLAETAITSYLVGDPDNSEPWGIRGKDGLRLPRLTRVTPDIARALASHNSELLALNGLAAISDDVAEALANFTGDLRLEGITELSARSEQLLGHGRCRHISVPQLRSLTDAAFAKKAFLEDIESATVEALQGLVEKQGTVASDRSMYLELQDLTPEQAAVLAKRQGGFGDIIFLDSVKQIDAATAGELAKAQIGISLCGLREITPEAAAAFASHGEAIYLMGIEQVPVELAEALAKKQFGRIFFDGRFEFRSENKMPLAIPEESKAILRNHSHVTLPRYLCP